jgi:hypothetical protein
LKRPTRPARRTFLKMDERWRARAGPMDLNINAGLIFAAFFGI